ncbi:MAG TPA: GNAT family N-acetyltransferase, partial [Solirubrobacteraceae bacterium]|nr:GNAT family N-acetyltransferase [Solirubrobacteraceae bacterium]
MPQPILTARLKLRPFVPGDAGDLFAIFSDPEVGRWVGGGHTTLDQSRDLIETNRAHEERHGFGMWAVERGGALIGEAGVQLLEKRGPEVEIGWVIARAAWGRGYATEAAGAWLDVAFGELGLEEVLATVLPDNAASHRVARRLGMEWSGR